MTDRRANKNKSAQEAISEYRRLATVELPHAVGRYATSRYSLLRVTPRTGRRHQIRRHMKHVFHPIIGDTTHGDGRHNRFFRKQFHCYRLLLAATTMAFTHPYTGKPVEINATLDDDFQRVVNALGWSQAVNASS